MRGYIYPCIYTVHLIYTDKQVRECREKAWRYLKRREKGKNNREVERRTKRRTRTRQRTKQCPNVIRRYGRTNIDHSSRHPRQFLQTIEKSLHSSYRLYFFYSKKYLYPFDNRTFISSSGTLYIAPKIKLSE